MKKIIFYYLLPLIPCSLLILLDQTVKRWANKRLRPVGTISIISGFVRFAYVENRGAAFGILQGARWIFVPLTLAALCVFAVFYSRLPKTKASWLVRAPMIFIFAGAVGNFVDRLLKGFVIDMFEFEFISFPVFNIADMCLVAGTITTAVMIMIFQKNKSYD